MSRRVLTALALSAIANICPAEAGENVKKCTMPVQECITRMSASLKTTGWVGIEYDDAVTTNGGYTVTKVIPGSPAEQAGLQPGDVLRALNGVHLGGESGAALAKARKEWKPGQSVTYTIKRAGVDRNIALTLAPMPADVMARWIGEHLKEHEAAERGSAK